MIALSPEQRLACQRTFIVSTEIHYNINNCAFPAKLDSYHTSAVDPVLGTQNTFLQVSLDRINSPPQKAPQKDTPTSTHTENGGKDLNFLKVRSKKWKRIRKMMKKWLSDKKK